VVPWQALGKHRFRVERDLVFIEWHGAIELSEMQAVYGMLPPIHAELGQAFFLADLSDSELPAAPVRSWVADWQRTHRELTGGAAFGAGLTARSMFSLMTRAISLITNTQVPVRLFATEFQARIWIDELRLRVG
jgi:hypothetical protein